MVNFNTWSRVINGIRKESLIDHVYVNEPSSITNVKSLEPTFGDHLLIIVDLIFCTLKSTKNKIIRQWGGYSVNSINVKLSALLMELTEPDQFVSVQNHWNLLEFVLIKATDALVPLKSVNEKKKKTNANSVLNNAISFDKIHEINKKCTPSQIMLYQASLNLHKTLNFEVPNYETITVLDQLAFTPRQTMFLIFRNNSTKIGMNTSSNKFYQLSGKLTLKSLECTFIHFKKLMKIQFLKNGKT